MTGRDLGLWVGAMVWAAATLASCAPDAEVRWEFAFGSAELSERASGIEAEVRQGGCGGRTVYTTWVGRGQSVAESPGRLKDGVYGFAGRARDNACQFLAEGCVEARVPAGRTIQVLLEALPAPELDPSCVTSPDTSGASGGDGDGDGDGPIGDDDGDVDSGLPDDGVGDGDGDGPIGDGDGDGDGDVTQDAGVDEPDASTPPASQCQNLDPTVVACFDFNGDLRDASSFGNHATNTSGTSTFEAAPLGEALRPDGDAIVVQDDISLNVSEVTIEVWFRPDSLRNLTGDPNETTLLVDKDQQYNLGYQTNGDPRGEAYRANDINESTTASAVDLVPGEWTYLAYTYDGFSARLFLEGTQVARETLNLDLFGGIGGTMHIGTGSPGATRPFDGLIDAVRISNRARSAAELCLAAGRVFVQGSCSW